MSGNPVRLYLDECIQTQAAEALRSVGIDTITAHEENLLGVDDEVQLEFATSQERVIVTYNINGDFVRLHAEWLAVGRPHWGIVLAPPSKYTDLRRIVAACRHTFTHSYPDDSYTRNRLLWIQSPP